MRYHASITLGLAAIIITTTTTMPALAKVDTIKLYENGSKRV